MHLSFIGLWHNISLTAEPMIDPLSMANFGNHLNSAFFRQHIGPRGLFDNYNSMVFG